MPEPPVTDPGYGRTVRNAMIIITVFVVLVGGYFLLRQMWIDTHCREILGTMICR